MAESEPLLNGQKDEEQGESEVSTYALWRSDLWDVCLLSGPACLQLLFQVSLLGGLCSTSPPVLELSSPQHLSSPVD